jgi:thioredoxin reductase
MEAVEPDGEGFVVRTNNGAHRTRSVLLTMGRRGTPRKLGVPGEESPKVVYRLIDPAQYDGQAALVVGGGDSALEAALALAERPGTDVTLSYRSAAFSRVKQKNRQALEEAQAAKRIRVELESNVVSIEPGHVRLQTKADTVELPNQAVIVCAGGQLPTPLLQKIGIRFETKHGTA